MKRVRKMEEACPPFPSPVEGRKAELDQVGKGAEVEGMEVAFLVAVGKVDRRGASFLVGRIQVGEG